MINIKTYRQYWIDMVTRITGLEDQIIVANEAQLKNKLTKNVKYPLLVATVPSSNPASLDAYNVKESNTGFIFILTKVAASDRDNDSYINTMESLQVVMKNIKEAMTEDFEQCKAPMSQLDVRSFHEDPEYNYLGHDGWSLSFKFDTSGY